MYFGIDGQLSDYQINGHKGVLWFRWSSDRSKKLEAAPYVQGLDGSINIRGVSEEWLVVRSVPCTIM